LIFNMLREFGPRWQWAFLALLTLAVFLNTLFFEFVWDDNIFLVGQAAYESVTLKDLLLTPLNGVEYLPLRDLTYIIDYRIWGWNPFGFHLTNLVLYILNIWAVYQLTATLETTLFKPENPAGRASAGWLPLVTAAMFIVLPLHSEVVSFIHGRNVLLSGLFFFLSCIYFLRFIDSQRRPKLLAAWLFFACALLSKATVIMLPGILLLFLLFKPERTARHFAAIVPFIALAAVFFFIYKNQAAASHFISDELIMAQGDNDIVSRLAVAVQIPFFYIAKLLAPVGLSTEYQIGFNRNPLSIPAVLAVTGLCLLLLLAYFSRKRFQRAPFALLWFLICLVPVSNLFLSNPVVADRYAYLPSYAYAYVLALLACAAKETLKPIILLTLVLAVLVVYGWLAFDRNYVWRTHESVMLDMTKPNSNRAKGYNALGEHYFDRGRFTEALASFAKAKEISPELSRLEFHQAKLAYQQNRPGEALELLDAASRIQKDQPYDAWILRGQIYESRGDLVQAARSYRQAVDAVQMNRATREQSAAILRRVLAKLEPSLEASRGYISQHPDDLNRKAEFAATLQSLGLNGEAIALYEDLLRRGGPRWEVYANLGKLYQLEGQLEQSIQNYRSSLSLNQRSAKIHNELGIVFIEAGQFEDALKQFQATVELDPGSANALLNLAKLHFHLGNEQAAREAFDRVERNFPEYSALAREYLQKLSR